MHFAPRSPYAHRIRQFILACASLPTAFGLSSASAAPRAAIDSPATFQQEFPATLATDDSIHTYARPKTSGRTPADDPRVDYVLTFDQPTTINRIRFIQHPHSFATAYRILAKTNPASATFDRVLVTADDPRTATGEWVEHRISGIEVTALKWETQNGFAERGTPYPTFAELQADHARPPASPPPPPSAFATVALNETLQINGVSRIHDTLFSVCNITGKPDFVKNRIAPLNLAVIPVWTEDFVSTLPIPEDPKAPGKFDRSFFETDAFDHAFARKRSGLDSVRAAGAFANMSLVKAPPYMRRSDFKSTGTGRFKDETQFYPPKDPAEWGELAAHTLKAINDRTGNLVKWVYIWNEPNAERYLPVPWREKSQTYMELFKAAVPPIKRLNPGLKIGGPVITGGGVLGWSRGEKGDEFTFWTHWAKRFLDECAPLADHFDAHYYGVDAHCLRAEATLFANYAHNTLGRPFPIAGSESNIILRSAQQVDPIAARWRYITVNYADLLLNALDLPDKMESLSYFYITDWKGLFGMFTDQDLEPNPIYWFYHLIRDLRGERLPVQLSDNDDNDNNSADGNLNLVAARNERRFNIVVQNKKSIRKNMTLDLDGLPANCTELTLERFEYDPATRNAIPTRTRLPIANNRVTFAMEPYGMYSLIGDNASAKPAQTVRIRKDFYGDRVFEELPAASQEPLRLKITIGDELGRADGATLKLAIGGLPHARPRRTVDQRVPLIVTVNGQPHRVLATNYNELELPLDLLKTHNTIEVTRDRHAQPHDDARIVNPANLWLLSTTLELRTKRPAPPSPPPLTQR
ncbi:GH39 family glycosyl hydrolase [Geminisphaera colitermitum]|uniref:GH39 family glycosyl hydrolase n=1 Tax=Geminisphaera colitermitum TaxID=1148786 RepID=UPI000693FB35|nr:glycosyl hydrolase family 39 [Geminisphaera colitermitum]